MNIMRESTEKMSSYNLQLWLFSYGTSTAHYFVLFVTEHGFTMLEFKKN